MKRITPLILAGCLLAPQAALAQGRGAGPADPAGFIHGTVETKSGNEYTGLLRWGTEEAFWDDLFNSSKEDLPYMKLSKAGQGEREINILGKKIRYSYGGSSGGRLFITRFGDIRQIRPRGGDKFELEMKSGTVYELDGGSNDIGGQITVADDALGEVAIKWSRIERITFSAAPRSTRPAARRLYGTLQTEYETFEGFVQWDSQECLTIDKLDGDTEDGDVSIAMGKIQAIEKRNRKSSRVDLWDGRSFVLDNSNDVNDQIRGIFVEDQRYGRVKVDWDVFVRVEFVETPKSGKGYADYKPGRPLAGSVTDDRGGRHTGRIIFDLDEAETWELLNGSRNGVEYYIPFELVRSVEPGRGDSSRVVLRGGIELELSDGQDVAERNAGIVVLDRDAADGDFIAWSDIRRIEFE